MFVTNCLGDFVWVMRQMKLGKAEKFLSGFEEAPFECMDLDGEQDKCLPLSPELLANPKR